MAIGSKASIGKMLASSFAERINSQGNLTLDKGNTLLADEEVEMWGEAVESLLHSWERSAERIYQQCAGLRPVVA